MPDELTPEQLEAQAQAAARAKAETDALAAEREKNKPSDREAELLKEVMAKKEAVRTAQAAAEAAQTQANELAERLKAFDGVNLDEVRELLAEKSARETAELEKRGEFDRVKEQMKEQHAKELLEATAAESAKAKELQDRLAAREKEITELTIGRSFSESPFIRDSLTLTPSKARVIYGAHFELQDGKVVAYDKPAGKDSRTPLVDANGDTISFEKAIEKLVDADPDRDNLLKSNIRGGAGSDNDPEAKAKQKQENIKGVDLIRQSLKNGGLPAMPRIN